MWPLSLIQFWASSGPSFFAVLGPREKLLCGPELGQKTFAMWVVIGSCTKHSPTSRVTKTRKEQQTLHNRTVT